MGIGGEGTAVPLGVVALIVSGGASLVFWLVVRPGLRDVDDDVLPNAPPLA